MSRHPAHLLLSAVAWLGFGVVTVWTLAFLAGVVVPRTVDGPDRTTTARAVAIDLALLLFFAVQHSVMARRQVKSWLSRWVPPALERTSFVFATNICLALLLVLWQPWGGQIWRAEGAVSVVVWSLCAAGWVLAIVATFAIDHLELVGLRQAGWAATRDPGLSSDLYVGGLYAVVRHPMMTGMLLAFWATPQMGASHLLFALAATGYIAVGVRFEERDLRNAFGASYNDYAARVPALLPKLPIRRNSAQGRPSPLASCVNLKGARTTSRAPHAPSGQRRRENAPSAPA
jgi:methanethiol S-methyltransferase